MVKALFLAAALFGSLVAQVPNPAPEPSPPPTPAASPASPSAAPSTTPSATPGAVPSASISPLPTPLVLPPEAAPQILAVQLSDPVFHVGEKITGTVITSTNVTAVEIHLPGRVAHVPRIDAGIWQATYQIPYVPFFMRHDYNAQIIATNGTGITAQREMKVSIR